MAIEDVTSALGLSLLCGLTAILIDLAPAAAVAMWLARRQFRGKAIVELLIMLPVVLPPVVIGYVLLKLLSRGGPLGAVLHWAGTEVVFTWMGAVLAQAVIAMPLLVLTLRVAFALVDSELEWAARVEGAGRWQTFWWVTLPLAWPGVAAGCMLALARALGEFGATVIVAGNIAGRTRTLPLAIVTATQIPGQEQQAMVLVAVAAVLAVVTLGLYRLFTWREASLR